MNERLRAEALEEMARRATAADPERTGARPLVSVIVDLPTLEGRAGRPAVVEGGGTISAEAARRLACDAGISRLLTDADGVILDLGRTVRTATADQWRLLRLRDRGCPPHRPPSARRTTPPSVPACAPSPPGRGPSEGQPCPHRGPAPTVGPAPGARRSPRAPGAALLADWFSEDDTVYDDVPVF